MIFKIKKKTQLGSYQLKSFVKFTKELYKYICIFSEIEHERNN